MLQRVDDLTAPPIVGRYYLVPCVPVSAEARDLQPGLWPITGPKHRDDGPVQFPWLHWHFDFRFMTSVQWSWAERIPMARQGTVYAAVLNAEYGPANAPYVRPGLGEVSHIRRRCNRIAPPFNHERDIPWIIQLKEEYSEAKVLCGKCPHRGLPLTSLPREPGTDIVTCPGHGLRWDLSTGKLMSARLNDRGD